jgi:adenylate kinase family enzyme
MLYYVSWTDATKVGNLGGCQSYNYGYTMEYYIPDGVGAIFITGPKHSGRRTFAETLHLALCEQRGQEIEMIDTGTLVNVFAQDRGGEIGDSVRRSLESGTPISDPTMNKVFTLWLSLECQRNPKLRTVIVSGGPRNSVQTKSLSVVSNRLLVNLSASQAEMLEIARGLGKDKGYNHHWFQYAGKTLLAIKGVNPLNVLHVDRTQPLVDRLGRVLQSLHTKSRSPVPPEIALKAIQRVHDPRHRIHKHIANIDHRRRQEFATAV